jgi:hypothetical protein
VVFKTIDDAGNVVLAAIAAVIADRLPDGAEISDLGAAPPEGPAAARVALDEPTVADAWVMGRVKPPKRAAAEVVASVA